LSELRDEFQRNTQRNLLLTGELIKLLKSFEASGIVAIPFKGPTLAVLAHGNLAYRQFNDLDLLLRPSDILGAKELLIARGYRLHLPISPAQEKAYLQSIAQLPFLSGDGNLLVELHSRLMPQYFYFPLEFEELQGRLQSVPLGGRQVPTLSSEDLLLLLCAHGSKHFWTTLGWVGDLAELIRSRPRMDWPGVMQLAGRLRSKRMVLLGLYLASHLLGAPLPADIGQAVRADAVAESLGTQVIRRLFLYGGAAPGGWENARFHIRVREHLRDGVRYSLSLAFAPTVADWVAFRIPPSLSLLHYFFRPARLFGKYAKQGATALWRRGGNPFGPDPRRDRPFQVKE
jgi:hypothetical protein